MNRLLGQFLLCSSLVLVSFCAVAQTDRIQLPDIGASAETVLSPRFEKEYGESLIRQMRAFNVLVEDPQVQAYFSDMGYRLVSHSDRPDKHFNFVVIKESSINAFAAPGGVVALHIGLILAAKDESEVAGVLAHEVAHVTQLHLARGLENAQKMSIPMMLAMMGLILAGGGGGDVVQGAILGTQALAVQNQINFTRQNEHEADRLGILTLASSGYNPDGMANFFGKLGRLTRSNGEGPPEFLRTHPVTTTRVAEAANRAAQMDVTVKPEDKNFYLMQARLRVMQEEFVTEAIRYFNHQLETVEFTPISLEANQYGLALAYQRSGRYPEAQQIIDQLLSLDPNRLAYRLQQTELLVEMRQFAQAATMLEDLYRQFPGNHVIGIHLTRALLAQSEDDAAAQATVILREQLLEHNDNPALYDLYAQASTIAGDKIRAGEAIAEAHFLRGRLHESVLQLRELAMRDDLDYYQRARITSRLSELEIKLAEEGRRGRPG